MADIVTAEHVIEALGGPRALRRRLHGFGALHEQVREGLPYAALEAVAARFQLSRDEIATVLGLPSRTIARRKVQHRLKAPESDRLLRLGRIAALAEEVLGGPEKASRWLHTPNRALGGHAPLGQLDTDLGVRAVESVLLRVAHGVYS
jgi:putative toxin-antitoxin system antitoxin component (TIGR02293 family)